MTKTGLLSEVNDFGSVVGLVFDLPDGSQLSGFGHPRMIDDALTAIGQPLPFACEFDIDGAGLLVWFRPIEDGDD